MKMKCWVYFRCGDIGKRSRLTICRTCTSAVTVLTTMLSVCIARSSRGAGFPSQHHRFFVWSISRRNHTTDVEYRPIRSVLVANRGEWAFKRWMKNYLFHFYINDSGLQLTRWTRRLFIWVILLFNFSSRASGLHYSLLLAHYETFC